MAWPNVYTTDTPPISNYVWDPIGMSWVKETQPGGGPGGGSTTVSLDTSTASIGSVNVSSGTITLSSAIAISSGLITLTNPATSTSFTVEGPIRLGTSTTNSLLGNVALSSGTVTMSSAIAVSSGTITLSSAIAISSGVVSVSPVTLGTSTHAAVIGTVTLATSTTAAEVMKVGIGSTGQVALSTSPTNSEVAKVGIGSTGAVTATLGTSTAYIGDVGRPATLGVSPTYIVTTTAGPAKISSSSGILWFLTAYGTSTGTVATTIPGILRIHNATTASSTGATVVFSTPLRVLATSTGGSLQGSVDGSSVDINFLPFGMAFSTACSVDVTTNSTGTTQLANMKITALYSTRA